MGCGALVLTSNGPTHRYLGASPGCWALYGEILARDYGEFQYPPVHRLSVDAYCVQHPGVDSPQTRQSACVHLMSLCLVFERGMTPERTTKALRYFTHRPYPWLEPLTIKGAVTVLDVVGATELAEHTRRIEGWARSAWEAWAVHHATIRGWLDAK
jgi:hypothetical protein